MRPLKSRFEKHVGVVGQGVVGLISALRLIDAGFRVTLVAPSDDKRQASKACLGVSSLKGLILANDPLFSLKLRGHRALSALIQELEKRSGTLIPHSFSGVSEVFSGASEYQQIKKRIYHQGFQGAFGSFLKTKMGPQGSPGRSGELFYPFDGWYDPEAFLGALRVILEGSKQVVWVAGEVEAVTARSLRLKGEGEPRLFNKVLLCAGPYTPSLLGGKALRRGCFVDPGFVICCNSPISIKKEKAFISKGKTILLRRSRVLWGGFSQKKAETPFAVEAPSSRNLQEVQHNYSAEWKALGLSGNPFFLRAGVRSYVKKDRYPVVGELYPFEQETGGVWVNFAYHKSGFILADICAKGLVKQMLGETGGGLEFLSPKRKALQGA